jgi:hypothetical protein
MAMMARMATIRIEVTVTVNHVRGLLTSTSKLSFALDMRKRINSKSMIYKYCSGG